jgi:hypothetical protein
MREECYMCDALATTDEHAPPECFFPEGMPVSQPKVFKYGLADLVEGQIHYRFEFYETFIVHTWTLPHRLNRHIYLPVTRDGLLWMLSRD